MDLLVLLILHSTNSNQSRRGAERVLKVKVRNGLIQEALLQKTFRDYAQVGRLLDALVCNFLLILCCIYDFSYCRSCEGTSLPPWL